MGPLSDRLLVRITPDPLDPSEALAFVADPRSGGTCLFLGTVRDHSAAGDVTGLRYEAWEDEAEKRLGQIALLHRTGSLPVGDVSVAVAASAPHRSDAFEACRHGIERLKEDVPIWKKEALASGDSHWVMGS